MIVTHGVIQKLKNEKNYNYRYGKKHLFFHVLPPKYICPQGIIAIA
jgi:hypothetical protein